MSFLLPGAEAIVFDLALVAQVVIRSTLVLLGTGLVLLLLKRGSARRRSVILTLCGVALIMVLALSLASQNGNWSGLRVELPLLASEPGVGAGPTQVPLESAGVPHPLLSTGGDLQGAVGAVDGGAFLGLTDSAPIAASAIERAGNAVVGRFAGVGYATDWLSIASILLLVWASGVALMLARLLVGLERMRRISKRAATASASIVASVSIDQRRASTRLLFTDEVSVPMTWGVRFGRALTPTILLPLKARLWTRERLRVVLLHELGHIQQGDWAARMMARLVRSVYWWHPLVHWVSRRLELEQELACDEWVTQKVRPSVYARHLMSLHDDLKARPSKAFAVALPMLSQQQLERRMMNVLDPLVQKKSSGATTLLIAVCFLTLVAAVQPEVVRRSVLPIEVAPMPEVAPAPAVPLVPTTAAFPKIAGLRVSSARAVLAPSPAPLAFPMPLARPPRVVQPGPAPAPRMRPMPSGLSQASPVWSVAPSTPFPSALAPSTPSAPRASAWPLAKVAPTPRLPASLAPSVRLAWAVPSVAVVPQPDRELSAADRERADRLAAQIEELHAKLESIRGQSEERREQLMERSEELHRMVEGRRAQTEERVLQRHREMRDTHESLRQEYEQRTRETAQVREAQSRELRQVYEQAQKRLQEVREEARGLQGSSAELQQKQEKLQREFEQKSREMAKRSQQMASKMEREQRELARRLADAAGQQSELAREQQRALGLDSRDGFEAQRRAMEALQRDLEPKHREMEQVARELESKARELEKIRRREGQFSARVPRLGERPPTPTLVRHSNTQLNEAIARVLREEATGLGLDGAQVASAVKEVAAVLSTHRRVEVQDGGVREEHLYIVGSPAEVRERLTKAWTEALEQTAGSSRGRELREAIHRLGYELLELDY